MIPEQFLKIFESHPILGAILGSILILGSMFFMTVWWKDWPDWSFGSDDDDDDDDDDDELEETKYSVTWQQTRINLGDHGFPKSVEGTLTIKEEEN